MNYKKFTRDSQNMELKYAPELNRILKSEIKEIDLEDYLT